MTSGRGCEPSAPSWPGPTTTWWPAGPLAVVNTHLPAHRDDDRLPANRYTRVARTELDRLAGVLAGIDAALPVVAAGDVNLPRGSAALAGFLAATGLTDVMAGLTLGRTA